MSVSRISVIFILSCMLFSCASGKNQAANELISPLTVQWQRDVDYRVPRSSSGFSTPAIQAQYIAVGGQDQKVRILDRSGKEIMLFVLESSIESEGVWVRDSELWISDVKGRLYSLDIVSGKINWQKTLSSVVLGALVQQGNYVFVQTADNHIYSFDLNGDQRWVHSELADGLLLHAGSSPVADPDYVYAVLSNGTVVALRIRDGVVAWRNQLRLTADEYLIRNMKSPAAKPSISGDALIVSLYQGSVYRLSRKSGALVWRRNISTRSAPEVHGDGMLLTGNEGHLYLLSMLDGKTVWDVVLSDSDLLGPVRWGEKFVVADVSGGVHLLDAKGNIQRKTKVKARIDRIPRIWGDGVLIRNNLGSLYYIQ